MVYVVWSVTAFEFCMETDLVNFGNLFSLFQLCFLCMQIGNNSTCLQGVVRIQWCNTYEPDIE